MGWRVATAAAGLVLALAGTLVFVPTRWRVRDDLTGVTAPMVPGFAESVAWRWEWGRGRLEGRALNTYFVRESGSGTLVFEDAIEWPLVAVEQVLVLLVGGGLLVWAVRRERRRRAEAAS